MLWKTRESDGDVVVTGLGWLVILAVLPLMPLIYLVWRLYRSFSDAEQRERVAKIAEANHARKALSQRQHRYFFRQTKVPPQVFWLAETRYKKKSIPKRTGGSRKLFVPDDELKTLQKTIAKFVRSEHPHCEHKTANGFIKGRSTVTNAAPHLGCKVLVKLDVKDFFDSIDPMKLKSSVLKAVAGNEALADRILELCTYDNGLPQGAPSSPLLSNLYMWSFDKEMYSLCFKVGAKYSRYADDITLSLKIDDRDTIYCLIRSVESKLSRIGLRLNKKSQKLHILREHQAQRICGITINSGTTTISRKQRRLLRAAKHRRSQGLDASFTDNQLEGWDAYIKSVNVSPENWLNSPNETADLQQ